MKAVSSHSSKLLLKPSSSLLPSLSYLDPLEDFVFLFSWTAVVCVADLSVTAKGRERVSDGRRDGEREGEGKERGRERKEGARGGGRNGREREREE